MPKWIQLNQAKRRQLKVDQTVRIDYEGETRHTKVTHEPYWIPDDECWAIGVAGIDHHVRLMDVLAVMKEEV